MPKRANSWHRPTCPSASAFHCGSHDDRALRLAGLPFPRGEDAQRHHVVLGVGRLQRALKLQAIAGEVEAVEPRRSIELVRRAHRPRGPLREGRRRIRRRWIEAEPVQAPLEGTHDAVVVREGEAPFPGVEGAGNHASMPVLASTCG